MSDDEVLAVLGHELGHWKLYHTVLNLALAEVSSEGGGRQETF
jgi:STE24 endopeptidase